MKPINIILVIILVSAVGVSILAANNLLPWIKAPVTPVTENIVPSAPAKETQPAPKNENIAPSQAPVVIEDSALKAIKFLYPEARTLTTGDSRFSISEIKENDKFQYPELVKYVIFGSKNKSYYFTYSQPDNPPLQMQAILLGFEPLYGESPKFIQSEAYINKSTKVVCMNGNIKSIINPSGFGGYFEAIVVCSTYDSLGTPIVSSKLDSFMREIYAIAKQKGASDPRFAIIKEIEPNIGTDYPDNVGRICFSFNQSNSTKIFDQHEPFTGFAVDNKISADGPQGSRVGYENNATKINCIIDQFGQSTGSYKPTDPWGHEYWKVTVCCKDI